MAEQVEHTERPEGSAHAEHAEGHHINYVRVWAVLVVLLVISVLGPMIGIQAVTLVTAFGIAVVKAYLVAKNFMHITMEKRFISYAMVTCLVFMFLFFAGTAPDVMKPEGTRWVKPLWESPAVTGAEGGAHGSGGAHH
jgi:caa(3)-type oxidase subunit IV